MSEQVEIEGLRARIVELESRWYEAYQWQGKANGRIIVLEAALARGPQGKADAPVNAMLSVETVLHLERTLRGTREEVRELKSELESARAAVHGEAHIRMQAEIVRNEWQSRALAAEAKVKERLATERQGIRDRAWAEDVCCRDLKNDLDSALAAARGESALRLEAENWLAIEKNRCNDVALELATERIRLEAKVKELEARLTDAALVEAWWVPREVALNAMVTRFTLHDYRSTFSDYIDSAVRDWLSRNAQQAQQDHRNPNP